MYCRNCGSQLDDGVSFCPHCGAPTNTPYRQTGAPTAMPAENPNYMGVAGFVLSLVCIWLGALIVPLIVSLVLNIIACTQKKNCTKYNSFATAGLTITIILTVLIVMFYVLLIAIALTVPPTNVYPY